MDENVNTTGVWLFRVLVIMAAGAMAVSWLLPWWTVDIEMFGNDMVQIHPWGLVMDERLGDFTVLMKGAEMPIWFAPFMWTYFVLCMLAILVALIFGNREIKIGKIKMGLCQFLIGGVGISYFIVGIVTAIFASIRCKQCMGIPLLGRHFVELGDPLETYVNSRFLPGYWLIYVVAILLIVLALLRPMICERRSS